MSIALLCLATGEKYWQFIAPFLYSAKKFFSPHTPFLFTDCRKRFECQIIPQEPEGYPCSTLHRYHYFLRLREKIESQFTHVFYSDIDDVFVAPVTESDILSDGITATDHAAFHHGPVSAFDYERRPESLAFIPREQGTRYYAGGFIGGEVKAFFRMAEAIAHNVDVDSQNGILALWHDESHLNRYLLDNPPARILTPEFHYPEPLSLRAQFSRVWPCAYQPKIMCLEKKWKA